MSSSSSWSSSSASGVAAATVVGAALRLVRLGAEPLWLDEATTASFAARDLRGALFAEPNHPPLFTLLEHAMTRLGFGGDAGLRVLPAIFGILLVPAAAALAARLRLGRPAVVAWMMATAPLALAFAREARAYALLALLLVLATRVFVDVAERGRGLVAYAALSVLALHTHYLAAPALLAHDLALASTLRAAPPGTLRRWLVARGAVAAACLPWAFWVLGHVGAQARPWIGSPLVRVPYAALRFAVGYAVAPVHRELIDGGVRAVLADAWPWLPCLLVILAAWIVGARALARHTHARLVTLLLVVPWLVVLALAPLVNLVHERYLAWQLPFVALLAALAVDAVPRPRVALAALVAAQLACALPLLAPGFRYGKEEWRAAAALVDAAAPTATFCAPGYLSLALDRYRHGPPCVPLMEGAPVLPDPPPAAPFALVVSHGGPAEDALADRLRARYPRAEDWRLPRQLGIRVLVVRSEP